MTKHNIQKIWKCEKTTLKSWTQLVRPKNIKIKVENILEGCLDLIPSLLPFIKIQIMGEDIRNSRV